MDILYMKLMTMSFPILITGKKEWTDSRTSHIECRCNGLKISDSILGVTSLLKNFLRERVKRSCKLMKISGCSDIRILNEYAISDKFQKEVEECDLPEWDAL